MSSERPGLEPGLGFIVERLERQFQCFDSDTIAEVVRECAARFEGAPVQNYVFVLVERLARIRLQTPVAETAQSLVWHSSSVRPLPLRRSDEFERTADVSAL